ncbi:hypothetical protein [Latilactobacillus sakei]|uniref:hypothetical protein n=1 Tax=Latilactobacillus sakei TaxID=1599 RepID=UPI00241D64BB|nr:hypothetical protein [Latilactobacillus sakei]
MNFRTVIVAMIAFFVGISLTLMGLSFNKGDFGSVADWVSGVGSIFAIVAVYQQIKQSDKQYRLDKQSNLLIASGIRKIKNTDENGIEITTSKEELLFWGTNDGNTAGSFKFIGICTKKQYLEIINSEHDNLKSKNIDNYIIDPVLEVVIGLEERKFELIEPHCVSSEISIPLEYINNNWSKDREICLVYMDAVRNLYKKDIIKAV